MPRAQTSFVRLSYGEAGSGEPVVVLIHGWGFGNRSHLFPQFEHLAAKRRVLLLDLPGHGGSDPAPPDFGFEECASAIVGVVDATGVEKAVVCGHSFGALLAVDVAAAYPDRVAGAILLDPAPLLFPAQVREQGTMLAAALESDGWHAALQGYFSMLLSPCDPPKVRERVLRELGDVPRALAAHLMRVGMAGDGSAGLAKMRCPILLFSRAEQPLDRQRFLQLQPQAWVGQPVGTGHWLTISVPDQVNAAIDRFLEIVEDKPAQPGTHTPA